MNVSKFWISWFDFDFNLLFAFFHRANFFKSYGGRVLLDLAFDFI